MPWLFITLGLAALISSLYGLITALQGRRKFVLEVVELASLALAMFMHHTTKAGWIALVVALAIEALRQLLSRRPTPTPAAPEPLSTPVATIIDAPPPAVFAPPPETQNPVAPTPPVMPLPAPIPAQPPKPAAPPLISIALLKAPWQPAPEVFLASLRRGGERGAKLMSGAQGSPIRLSVDGVALELECIARPLPRNQIDDAAAQSWDWPEAATTVTPHVGHVIFTTRANAGTSRGTTIRLHCRAQQALAEFAPVIAVLWPDAGRLIPVATPAQVSALSTDFDLARATCINFRTFPLEGPDAGRFLCDTVGFAALGVADLEVECAGEPDGKLTAAIYHRARQMFEASSDINTDGATVEHEGAQWRIEHARSRFAPSREVARWLPPVT